MSERTTSVFASSARWALLLPVAIATAIAVRVAVFYINRYTLSFAVPFFASDYLGPDSLFGGGLVVLFADCAMGAAFIYVSTSIAPSYKRQVAIVLGAIALVFGSARSIYLLQGNDRWGAFTYSCFAMGSLLCAIYRLQEYRESALLEAR